jgi:hypothetical protein
MAITKYVPPLKKIIDNRKPEGGYYEADCEVCGGKFYPERSNAKYCTPNCGLIAHRIAVADGTALKRGGTVPKKKKPKPVEKKETVKKEPLGVLTGKGTVKDWIRSQELPIHGIGRLLNELEIGDDMGWRGIQIKRISANKYEVS